MHQTLASHLAATRETLSSLASHWAAGEITPQQFGDTVDQALLAAHAGAVRIGRWHAGDRAPAEEDDLRFAETVRDEEAEFLAAFVRDLDGDRYRGEDGSRNGVAVARRASLYANRLIGTANEAWALTLPEETELTWILGEPETSHCEECPALAAASPYTPATLPTYPGQGRTPCITQCLCSLETSAGQAGFSLEG